MKLGDRNMCSWCDLPITVVAIQEADEDRAEEAMWGHVHGAELPPNWRDHDATPANMQGPAR